MTNKVYDIVTEKIIEQLEAGTIPWRKAWTGPNGLPMNLISGKPYSGINFLLLSCAGYASSYWVTYKQAQQKGGNVKKGEKGTLITYWGNSKEKKNAQGETTKNAYRFLKYYNVFNLDQCDGIKDPTILNKPLDFNPINEAEKLVNLYIGKPSLQHCENQAYYSPMVDIVNMPKKENFESVESYYATLFHEYGHSTGHANRLNRPEVMESTHFGSNDYSKEELVAEMASAFLCAIAGIGNTLENSTAYIKGWLRKLKDNKDWVICAGSKARKASDYIQGIDISKG